MDVGFCTAFLDIFKHGEFDRDIRLLAAQGAFGLRADERRGLLGLLVGDPDSEIARTVEETLRAGSVEEATVDVQPDASEPVEDGEQKKGSVLERIAAMNPAQRLALAMKGTREERTILIRAPNKIVTAAVLSSPKNDGSRSRRHCQDGERFRRGPPHHWQYRRVGEKLPSCLRVDEKFEDAAGGIDEPVVAAEREGCEDAGVRPQRPRCAPDRRAGEDSPLKSALSRPLAAHLGESIHVHRGLFALFFRWQALEQFYRMGEIVTDRPFRGVEVNPADLRERRRGIRNPVFEGRERNEPGDFSHWSTSLVTLVR